MITEFSSGISRKQQPAGHRRPGRTATCGSPRTPIPGAIGRITPAGDVTEFTTGLTTNSRPLGIAAGPDGNLWFTESKSPGRIGRITTDGEITEYSDGFSGIDRPWGIAAGPDGNMWFTGNNDPGLIGRITLPPLVRDMAADTIATTVGPPARQGARELAGHRLQLRVRHHDRVRQRDARGIRRQRLRPERP